MKCLKSVTPTEPFNDSVGYDAYDKLYGFGRLITLKNQPL